MNRKQQIKWRFRRFRLRSAVFMRRNGLYLALAGCLASLGGAAVLIFTAGGNDAPNAPVNRSDDQRLENVLNTVSAESGTPVPAVETPAAGTALPRPTPLALPEFTPMPELSPEPEPTADGVLSGLKPPVDGTVMKSFAINSLLYSETLHQWMTHPGVDIECSKGSEVRAIADGTIENVYVDLINDSILEKSFTNKQIQYIKEHNYTAFTKDYIKTFPKKTIWRKFKNNIKLFILK